MAPSNYSFEATDLVASFFTYIALFFVACLVAKSRISMAFADNACSIIYGFNTRSYDSVACPIGIS